MKVSRSTSRPRRLGRHRSGGPWIAVVSLLVLAGGGAFLGNELGWFSSKKPAVGPSSQARLGTRPSAPESRLAEAPRPTDAGTPSAAPTPPASRESVVPSGMAISAPRFGKDFDDAIARGDFRAAERAMASIGGDAGAEHRLAAAMTAAKARIAAKFDEISRTTGERAARVYVTHQMESFPDHAEARMALQALLTPQTTETGDVVAATSRPAVPAQPAAQADPIPNQVDLVAMKDEASKFLDAGEIKAALSVLREVASAADARHDQALVAEAQRLIRQGEAEIRLRQAIVAKITQSPPGDRTVPHLPGERGPIIGATEEAITFGSAKGQVALKWRVLPVHSLSAIIQMLDLPPKDMTDAAATLYRAGHASEADALLAKALPAGGDVKKTIDQVLADARGMSMPPEGFRLVDDKWLSPQEFARHEIVREMTQSTKDLASPDAAVRRTAFTRMVKLGDAVKSPLHRALLLRRAEIREDLQKAPVHAKLADLGKKRAELDESRAHALALIEDEVKYPYPYRPPEASPEAFKLYQESQKEINIRVAKLRGLWDQQIAVPLPKPFKDKVALLVEIGTFLSELGAGPFEADPGWLIYLPGADEVTLQTVATSEYDRKRIDESAEAMKTNATRGAKSTKGELDQVKITNEYRIMFGRGAVLVHDLLTAAAHGHCDDMARLGFFAHQSPVVGKATPWDRIKLTGMKAIGASENIAEASGPSGAHNGWCHSSGHHRNLLAAGWKLLGVGNVGHYWCQNFCAGEEKPLEETPGDGDEPK